MSGDMLPIPAAVLTVGIIRFCELSSQSRRIRRPLSAGVTKAFVCRRHSPIKVRKPAILLMSRETAADIQQASNADLSNPTLPSARLIAEPVAQWLSFH